MNSYNLKTKKQLEKAMVESVACYGCEVWLLKRGKEKKLLALEIDCLRSARSSIFHMIKFNNIETIGNSP